MAKHGIRASFVNEIRFGAVEMGGVFGGAEGEIQKLSNPIVDGLFCMSRLNVCNSLFGGPINC